MFAIAVLAGAIVVASPPNTSAQFFNPVPQQAGPNAPRETPDYPVPTVATPQGAMPAVPMPPPPASPYPSVQYPSASPAQRPGIAIQVIPAPAATPAPGPATVAPAAPRPAVAASPSAAPRVAPTATQAATPPSSSQVQTAPGQAPAGQTQAGLSTGGQAPAASNQPDPWQPRGGVELRALDKVNARSLTLSGRIGEVIRYATLTIVVRACVVRAPDQEADAAAFLDITDSRPNTPAFHGWMLQDEPGMMVYEHPVYDVRMLGCHA